MTYNEKQKSVVYYGAMLLIFAPWIYLQSMVRIPSDAAWLMSAAEHILNGQALSEYYFDTNPPLCFLIYIPAVLLEYLGLKSWQALQIYTLILSFISFGLTAYFLKKWDINETSRRVILVFYAIGLICLPFLEYGQKDHLIAIALLPFLLAQLSITYHQQNNKKLDVLTLILFVPFILIKPHYGLLPAAVLVHRLFKTKSWKAILDADFIILTLASLIYLGAIYVFFHDFIELVLPLSLSLYVQSQVIEDIHKFALTLGFLSLCLIGLSACSKDNGYIKTLGVWLSISAFLTIIPYWIQLKGFSVHLIPFNLLAITAFGAVLAQYHSKFIDQFRTISLFALLCVSAASTSLIKNNIQTFSHDYYRNHEIAKIIKPTGQETSFFIEHSSTTTVMQLSEYLEMEFASRFVSNWFTFDLASLEENKHKRYWKILGDFYAEDLKQYQPETLMFIKHEKFHGILHIFQDHDTFQKAIKNYKFERLYMSDELFAGYKKISGESKMPYYVFKRIENEERQ